MSLGTDARVQALARFNWRLFWGMVIPLERMPAELQARHVAMAEEQLKWLEGQGWMKGGHHERFTVRP